LIVILFNIIIFFFLFALAFFTLLLFRFKFIVNGRVELPVLTLSMRWKEEWLGSLLDNIT
jgi:hypothetical protein